MGGPNYAANNNYGDGRDVCFHNLFSFYIASVNSEVICSLR